MAACVLACGNPGSSSCPLERCKELLKTSEIVSWSVEDIRSGSARAVRTLSTGQVIEMTSEYVTRHSELLATCDVIVIEQQPAAKMRNASIALYCFIRSALKTTHVAFQPACRKLDWGCSLRQFLPSADTTTKSRRKSTARCLVDALLRACGDSKTQALETFHKHKKRTTWRTPFSTLWHAWCDRRPRLGRWSDPHQCTQTFAGERTSQPDAHSCARFWVSSRRISQSCALEQYRA